MLRRTASLLLAGTIVAFAAPPAPPAPETYNVVIRYRIDALRTQRIRQFNEMALVLRGAGFKRNPADAPADDEAADRRAIRMTGTLPSRMVPKVAVERHVRGLLLWPAASKLPEKDGRSRVEVYLSDGYAPDTQRRVARETSAALGKFGFKEAFGYDDERATRLVGSMPGASLEKALGVKAVRVVVARPDWPIPSVFPAPGKVPAGQEKFSPALRALLTAGGGEPARLEAILGSTPMDNLSLIRLFKDTGAVVEGRIGPLVTLAGVPKEIAPKAAALYEVVALRLPQRATRSRPVLGGKPAKGLPFRRSGLDTLHREGRRGKGTRIAVIADDFAGWQELRPQPRMLDLTRMRSRRLEPEPFASAGKGQGQGTQDARAVIAAAPEAEVTLVRINASAPYMLQAAAQAINGDRVDSPLLERRYRDMIYDRDAHDTQAARLKALRAAYLDNPVEDAPGLARKKAFEDAQKRWKDDEAEIRERQRRWIALGNGIRGLKGVRVVANTLVWSEGYPTDGTSALSRWFDDRPFKAALWFNAAGDTRGQAWAGTLRDQDGNGFLEILDEKRRLPGKDWTREIAWLAWQGADGKKSGAAPGGTTLRIVLQWREAHDPLPLKSGEDPYRTPLADFQLVAVSQTDPEGGKRPADDIEVVGQSIGTPIRLEQSSNSATYEATIEFKVSTPGRVGVMVKGKLPDSTQAPGEASLPTTRKKGEVSPRLFVSTVGGAGRAVWADLPATASLGMPADARRVLAVGSERADSAAGVHGSSLLVKPDLLSFGGEGTAQAACFAAGLAASAAGAKGSLTWVLERVRDKPGALLVIPGRRRGK